MGPGKPALFRRRILGFVEQAHVQGRADYDGKGENNGQGI
jgi:hypothetical protein